MSAPFSSSSHTSPDSPDLVWPQPTDNTKVFRKIAGWATFGLAVRAFQLGILKKPLRTNPQAYGYTILGWGAIGYGAYHVEARQRYLLARKRVEIEASRDKERDLLQAGSLGNALPA